MSSTQSNLTKRLLHINQEAGDPVRQTSNIQHQKAAVHVPLMSRVRSLAFGVSPRSRHFDPNGVALGEFAVEICGMARRDEIAKVIGLRMLNAEGNLGEIVI